MNTERPLTEQEIKDHEAALNAVIRDYLRRNPTATVPSTMEDSVDADEGQPQ